jgi:hypothetical protein
MNERWVAVLGWKDQPTDAVEEYCHYLGAALAHQGARHEISLELLRVRWPEIGWRAALRELRGRVEAAPGNTWFLLQYTALGWSRRGFSWRVLRVIRLLRKSKARCAVVFHDAEGYYGNRVRDRIRRAVQIYTMRKALRLADLAVFTLPPAIIPWASKDVRAVFIPVGANLPSPELVWPIENELEARSPSIAAFSLSPGATGTEEVRRIAEAVRYVAERIGKVRLVAIGRHFDKAEADLREKLADLPVNVTVHGLLTASEVVRVLGACDVLLFARGPLSTRRGSAIAGIACGLPVVGREGWETTAPITEAGVVIVPADPSVGFGPSLLQVLSDDSYRASLAKRSRNAQAQYFSWAVIAAQYAQALRERRD